MRSAVDKPKLEPASPKSLGKGEMTRRILALEVTVIDLCAGLNKVHRFLEQQEKATIDQAYAKAGKTISTPK